MRPRTRINCTSVTISISFTCPYLSIVIKLNKHPKPTPAPPIMPPPHGHGHGSFMLPFFVSLLLLCPARLAGAAEYTVGDASFGWDTGTNYATWAQKHTFTIGDVLVFQYVTSQHNVYEVTESTYRSCDDAAAGGVVRRYTSGYDRVELTEAKNYWFICDVPGHCLGGMRFAVNVSAAGPGGGPSPNNVPLPPYGNAATSPAGGGCRSWMVWALGALVLVINWAT